jgi:uracil-DNA glycosylase
MRENNLLEKEIMTDSMNVVYTQKKIRPLYSANRQAKMLIITGAISWQTQIKQQLFQDKSGQKLAQWLNISQAELLDSQQIAILPLDFYCPNNRPTKIKKEVPPRKEFFEKWHPRLLSQMPCLKLKILLGKEAIKSYLHLQGNFRLTDVVANYQSYLPEYFPIIHPSARNQLWLSKNPWFISQVIPALQRQVELVLRS